MLAIDVVDWHNALVQTKRNYWARIKISEETRAAGSYHQSPMMELIGQAHRMMQAHQEIGIDCCLK